MKTKNDVLYSWVNKLALNVHRYREHHVGNPKDFIHEQQVLLGTTDKILEGKAFFIGCPQPNEVILESVKT